MGKNEINEGNIIIQFNSRYIIRNILVNENLIKIGKAGEGVNSILFLLPSEKKHAQIASHFVKRDRKNNYLKILMIFVEWLFQIQEIHLLLKAILLPNI